MIRLTLSIGLQYEVGPQGADFVFNIHAAQTHNQIVLSEALTISPSTSPKIHTDAATGNRYMRLHAVAGDLQIQYHTEIELRHHRAEPLEIAEVAVAHLPPQVMGYLYPSRYCQSDLLGTFAHQTFGKLPPGYVRVVAIQNWVKKQIMFASNTSNSATSALDTLISRTGVCRDFAHLMIALCRALNLPARFATGTDYGADPALGPHDFHAYVEVYLGDRWYLFDPSGTGIPMGFVRLGTGRDAADVAVATIFGLAKVYSPVISTIALKDARRGMVLPYLCEQALSTARWRTYLAK